MENRFLPEKESRQKKASPPDVGDDSESPDLTVVVAKEDGADRAVTSSSSGDTVHRGVLDER